MISSKVAVPVPPKKEVSNIARPVIQRKMASISTRMPPPNTEVGIRDTRRKGTDRLSIFEPKRATSSTRNRLMLPQALKSQKFNIAFTSRNIFMSVIDLHIFKGIESLVALDLVDLLTMIYI